MIPIRIPRFVAAFIAFFAAAPAATADAVEDFYKGNQVTVVVSSGSGGMNALYARTIGEFFGRHIPGKPKVIMQHMPGGGGIKGTNYCYNVAPKDGSVLCNLQMGLTQAQLLGQPGVKFDMAKFTWLGRASSENSGIFVWHTVPAKTLLDVREHEVILAASGRGSETYTDPTIINAALGTKFKVVLGYPGGADMDLALERGETNGDAGPAVSVFTRKQHWIDNKLIRFLVQSGSTRHPRLPDVPLLTDFARNDEERQMFAFLSARAEIGRTYLGPPDLPVDRTAALRKAFMDTMRDPAFRAEAGRRKLDVIPASAEQVHKTVTDLLATPPAVVAKVKAALGLKE